MVVSRAEGETFIHFSRRWSGTPVPAPFPLPHHHRKDSSLCCRADPVRRCSCNFSLHVSLCLTVYRLSCNSPPGENVSQLFLSSSQHEALPHILAENTAAEACEAIESASSSSRGKNIHTQTCRTSAADRSKGSACFLCMSMCVMQRTGWRQENGMMMTGEETGKPIPHSVTELSVTWHQGNGDQVDEPFQTR